MGADYDMDKAQFFRKEAFQAFELMDDRSPDYYISYNPFKSHDDQDSCQFQPSTLRCLDCNNIPNGSYQSFEGY